MVSIEHAIFHCLVVCLLCELIESYMIHMLHGPFLVLDANSVYSNMSLLLDRKKHYECLCLLVLMQMVVWMTRDEVHGVLPFSSHQLIVFFQPQVKIKIKVERKRLSSQDFVERWMTVV